MQQVFHEFSAVFDEVADPYLRERKGDVADLVGRLRMNLRQGVATPRDLLRELDESSVLIADELTPSLAAQVDWTKVRGFATDAGSRTYHTAILARSLDVPAVVGLHDASELVQAGQLVVIDGDRERADPRSDADELRARGPVTPTTIGRRSTTWSRPPARRGAPPTASASASTPTSSSPTTWRRRATPAPKGIGLYRSEFLRHRRRRPDIGDEDEQYQIYRGMLEGMAPRPVTVRTFDVDEDQLASRLIDAAARRRLVPDEHRASRQGCAACASSLTRPRSSQTQLRALLRAAAARPPADHVSVRVERRAGARGAGDGRRGARADLAARGIETPRVPIGVMIEIPAAAYTADLLAREVDFFTSAPTISIQYCLAVDRADERVSRCTSRCTRRSCG